MSNVDDVCVDCGARPAMVVPELGTEPLCGDCVTASLMGIARCPQSGRSTTDAEGDR